jgi:hypothetical protein
MRLGKFVSAFAAQGAEPGQRQPKTPPDKLEQWIGYSAQTGGPAFKRPPKSWPKAAHQTEVQSR